MKIGIFSQWFDPEPGPASIVSEFAYALSSAGHDVRVLTGLPSIVDGPEFRRYRAGISATEEYPGLTVRRVNEFRYHGRNPLLRLANYVSFAANSWVFGRSWLAECDVVWIYFSPVTLAALIPYLKRRRVGVILHAMDVWPENIESSGFLENFPAKQFIIRTAGLIAQFGYVRADWVLALTPKATALLKKRTDKPERVLFFPLWARESVVYEEKTASLRDQFGVSEDTTLIVYAGTLGKTQMVDRLVRAVEHSLSAGLRVACWVVGFGTEASRVREMIHSSQFGEDEIRYFGAVDVRRASQIIAASDVQFIAITPDENAQHTIPSKFQNTLAHGKPVLALSSGDLANLIQDNRVGVVMSEESFSEDFQSAIRLGRLEWAQMGLNGRNLYEKEYSLWRAVEMIENLFIGIGADDSSERIGKRFP